MFIFYVCPKCGKLFATDKSPVCMFCGFNGPCPNLTAADQQEIEKADDKWRLNSIFQEKYVDHSGPYYDQETFDKREEYEENYRKAIEEEKQESIRKAEEEERKYVPRCPTCGSPRVFNRGTGAGKTAYGLMVHKQYVCNNCGYEW